MGLRTLMRTTTTFAAATIVAALLTAPSATARPCANCEDPELPGPGGPSCSVAATSDPAITSPVSPATLKVGDTVTAHTGTWNSAAKSMRASWYVDGASVENAGQWSSATRRTLTYTVKATDLNKTIWLWVRAFESDTNCYKTRLSEETAAVSHGNAPVASVAPSISGEAKVGSTLTAVSGTWSPTPTSYEYVWRVDGGSDDGTYRGNTPTYELTAADVGKRLRVEVSTVLNGYYSATRTLTTGPVAPGDVVTATTGPTITGNPVYGETLTVDDGTWAPTPTNVERQWLRDGEPISGADGATYQLGLADVGKTISVEVSAQRTGHPSGTATVEAATVARAAAPRWTGKKVGLKGKNKVKKKVKVALGAKKIRTAAAAPDATVTYQWLRKGKVIRASTKKAHKIVKADRKKKLKARITITRPGHHPLVITTKAVKIKNNGKKIR